MQLLPAGQRTAQAWKNGGGSTAEVAVFPAGAGWDDFGWRVSIASLAQSGPFSAFPGIERSFYLLDDALQLVIDDQTRMVDAHQPLVEFSGEAKVAAELPSTQPQQAVNVMSRRGRFAHSLRALELDGSSHLELQAEHTLLLVVRGSCRVNGESLQTLDACLIESGARLDLEAAPQTRVLMVELYPS